MANLIKRMFSWLGDSRAPEPPHEKWPPRVNIEAWMRQEVAYCAWLGTEKDSFYSIADAFNPSSWYYLPARIYVELGDKGVRQHQAAYLALQAEYPEAVKRAREEFQPYSYFPMGPSCDYPS